MKMLHVQKQTMLAYAKMGYSGPNAISTELSPKSTHASTVCFGIPNKNLTPLKKHFFDVFTNSTQTHTLADLESCQNPLGNLRINLNDVKDEQQHLLITFVLLNPILCVLGNDPQRSLKTLIKKLNTSVPPLSFLTSEYLKKLGQMTGVAAPPVQQVKKQHLRYGQSVLGCQTSVPTGECYYNGE